MVLIKLYNPWGYRTYWFYLFVYLYFLPLPLELDSLCNIPRTLSSSAIPQFGRFHHQHVAHFYVMDLRFCVFAFCFTSFSCATFCSIAFTGSVAFVRGRADCSSDSNRPPNNQGLSRVDILNFYTASQVKFLFLRDSYFTCASESLIYQILRFQHQHSTLNQFSELVGPARLTQESQRV